MKTTSPWRPATNGFASGAPNTLEELRAEEGTIKLRARQRPMRPPIKVEILRPCYVEKILRDLGEVVECPPGEASLLVAAGKAQYC